MPKRGKYPAKVPYNVVQPLADLLKANPDLPYKSVNDAIKHAVAYFTDYLRQKTSGVAPPLAPSEASVLDEIAEVIRRHSRRDATAPKRRT